MLSTAPSSLPETGSDDTLYAESELVLKWYFRNKQSGKAALTGSSTRGKQQCREEGKAALQNHKEKVSAARLSAVRLFFALIDISGPLFFLMPNDG